jgi:hypothetical protein
MNKNGQTPKMNIDLTATQPVKSEEGNMLFGEAYVLRKVSKFVAGTTDDAILPIPVMYDIKTGKVLLEMIPKELREEFETYNNSLSAQ